MGYRAYAVDQVYILHLKIMFMDLNKILTFPLTGYIDRCSDMIIMQREPSG